MEEVKSAGGFVRSSCGSCESPGKMVTVGVLVCMWVILVLLALTVDLE
jgi:hypothetical protein